MGIEELIGRLERDASARIAAVEARTKREVEAIESAARGVSSHARGEALAARRAERRARLDRDLAEVRHNARADGLRAERVLIERVIARASALLDAVETGEAYVTALPARLAEALRFVEGAVAVVRCRPPLAPAVRRALAGRPDVGVEEFPAMPAGFTVIAREGSVEVDDTLPARLARMEPRLCIELLTEITR